MSEVIPTAQNLPEGACFTSWQSTLDAFAAAMRVELPDELGAIIISETTPDPMYNGRIWFKVDEFGKILGIYSFSTDTDPDSWVLADPYPYYFVDEGTNNALSITTGENIAANSEVNGRLFLVKVAANNTLTTVTFAVDAAPAAELRKDGTTAIEVGDLKADMVAILVFTGTYFQLLNPVQKTIPTILKETSTAQSIPTAGNYITWAHTLGEVPFPWSATFYCTTANNGYAEGDPLPYWQVEASVDSNNEQQAFSCSPGDTQFTFVATSSSSANWTFMNKTSGALVTFVANQWEVVFEGAVLTPAA